MRSLGASRWDGNVHYYDYKPDALGRDTSRIDAWIVAEAFIYDDSRKTEKVAITVLASGEDLEIDKVPRGEAVRIGEAIREQAIAKHRDQLPVGHRAVVYNLRGREIETQEE